MLVGPVGWSHSFLVLLRQICPFLDQVFDHLILVPLDGIVDWPFVLRVSQVKDGPIIDEVLGNLYMTLSDGIVDWSLPVLVLLVELCALLYEELDDVHITLSNSIEHGTLLEEVLLGWIDPHLNEHLAHPQGQFVIRNNTSKENWSLGVIVGLLKEVGHVHASLADEPDNLIDLSLLDQVEGLLLQLISHGHWSPGWLRGSK